MYIHSDRKLTAIPAARVVILSSPSTVDNVRRRIAAASLDSGVVKQSRSSASCTDTYMHDEERPAAVSAPSPISHAAGMPTNFPLFEHFSFSSGTGEKA